MIIYGHARQLTDSHSRSGGVVPRGLENDFHDHFHDRHAERKGVLELLLRLLTHGTLDGSKIALTGVKLGASWSMDVLSTSLRCPPQQARNRALVALYGEC